MNIEDILLRMNLGFTSFTEVFGGTDTKVYKVGVQKGPPLALRILPSNRYEQLCRDQEIMELAHLHGIQVPKVYDVKLLDQYAVMLMGWASGQTVFNELQKHPEKAFKLGVEFGKVQASIHTIRPSLQINQEQTWLSPDLKEQKVIQKISTKEDVLLHLDFHPLNVLTDGEVVTAVIDWTNASIGDYRFDIARTYSILKLVAPVLMNDQEALYNFELGWKAGYQAVAGPIHDCRHFNEWAGLRIKRDLAKPLLDQVEEKIDEWVKSWGE